MWDPRAFGAWPIGLREHSQGTVPEGISWTPQKVLSLANVYSSITALVSELQTAYYPEPPSGSSARKSSFLKPKPLRPESLKP